MTCLQREIMTGLVNNQENCFRLCPVSDTSTSLGDRKPWEPVWAVRLRVSSQETFWFLPKKKSLSFELSESRLWPGSYRARVRIWKVDKPWAGMIPLRQSQEKGAKQICIWVPEVQFLLLAAECNPAFTRHLAEKRVTFLKEKELKTITFRWRIQST